MKPKHATAPRLCSQCAIRMRREIEIGNLQTGFVFCEHRNTLAIFTVKNRAVTLWHLFGPVSADDALAHVGRVAENFERGLAAMDMDLPTMQ